MADDVTLGEVVRRLDSLEKRMDGNFGNVTRQLENLQFVHRDTYSVQMAAVVDRLEALEESKAWVARGLVTCLIFPVVVAIILAVVLTQ